MTGILTTSRFFPSRDRKGVGIFSLFTISRERI
jgi:hypothetical protein